MDMFLFYWVVVFIIFAHFWTATSAGNVGQWRVINGKKADSGQFTWQIAILKNFDNICGGSLLDETTVLTAAHCFDQSRYKPDYEVIVGHTNIDDINWNRVHRIRAMRIHRSWNKKDPDSANDIAILKIRPPVKMVDGEVQHIELPKNSSDHAQPGDVCEVSGWGALNTAGDDYPSHLQYAPLTVVDNDYCSEVYGEVATVRSQNTCALGDGQASCFGDSGGPLVCKRNGKVYLEGVVSFGSAICLEKGIPEVFTRVSYFLNWIKKNRT